MLKKAWCDRDKIEQASSFEKDSVVNYLWLSSASTITDENSLNSVPQSYHDKAFQNAARYPNTKFCIWIDFETLDTTLLCCPDTQAVNARPANVEICDLRAIEAYKEIDIFQQDTLGKIWPRVDLARLLILQHCLDSMAYENVFYADFDVADIQIRDSFAIEILELHGMLFGDAQGMIENGFIALTKKQGATFLNDYLLPATITETKNTRLNGDGYNALAYTLNFWCHIHAIEEGFSTLSVPRLQRTGYKMPSAVAPMQK